MYLSNLYTKLKERAGSSEGTPGPQPSQNVTADQIKTVQRHPVTKDTNTGIDVSYWLWGASIYPKAKNQNKESEVPTDAEAKDGYATAMDILLKNPDMSASTLLNYLKAQGLDIVLKQEPVIEDKPVEEADTASAQPTGILAGKKKEASISFTSKFVRLQESAASDDGIGPTRFDVILLQEGLGNLKDTYYYTKEALNSAVPIFEGKKIYADHPSATDEQVRPERSVRDVLGHFENIHVEESEDGRSQLCGEVVILADKPFEWARGLMRHAVEFSKKYPDKEFIGLSINASGDAEEVSIDDFIKENDIPKSILPKLLTAKEQGSEFVHPVRAIVDAVSCDMVTEAGAGGRILDLLEKEFTMSKNKKKVIESDEKEKKEAAPEAPKKDEGHDDADKDKELITSMIKKHLGDEDAANEEVHEAYAEALKCAKETGLEGEEAHQAAALSMRLGKHMAGKKKDEAEEPKDEPKDDGDEDDKKESKEEETKESEEKEETKESALVKAVGKIAFLESELRAFRAKEHLEKLLKESKLPVKSTDLFRGLVESEKWKTAQEIEKQFKVFKKTIETNKAGEAEPTFDYFLNTEKTAEVKSEKSLSFDDCLS